MHNAIIQVSEGGHMRPLVKSVMTRSVLAATFVFALAASVAAAPQRGGGHGGGGHMSGGHMSGGHVGGGHVGPAVISITDRTGTSGGRVVTSSYAAGSAGSTIRSGRVLPVLGLSVRRVSVLGMGRRA